MQLWPHPELRVGVVSVPKPFLEFKRYLVGLKENNEHSNSWLYVYMYTRYV